ncbi:BrnT family toxin [Oscillatoria amoena NRMC-F 0135]|nr:BrnT family toxin [Oscillatoria amoena NRMC-F 0135]
MLLFDWNDEKNEWLKQERGVTFEDIVFHLSHDGLLDTIEHPNQKRYHGQRILIVNVDGYACLVPFVEEDGVIFLKTIIPSRKMTKLYLGGDLI